MPEAAPRLVGLPSRIHSTSTQASPAAAAARNVFMNAWAACPLAARAEPALKPNQPNHRMPGADHHERHRVRRLGLARPAPALAEHEHGGQRGDAGVDVDGRAAGEVERPALAEPGERGHPPNTHLKIGM